MKSNAQLDLKINTNKHSLLYVTAAAVVKLVLTGKIAARVVECTMYSPS
jgi:hypothetical protein